MSAVLVDSLRQALGPRTVLPGEEESTRCTIDWRRLFSGRALCVVRPASTAEVATTLRLAAEALVAVVPQGGNTGLSGRVLPRSERD